MVQRLYRRVELTQGKYAWVDPDEYERVMAAGPWCAYKGSRAQTWYAERNVWVNGRRTTQRLHTFITGWPMVDHKDRNGLHNWRNNMREATQTLNPP